MMSMGAYPSRDIPKPLLPREDAIKIPTEPTTGRISLTANNWIPIAG